MLENERRADRQDKDRQKDKPHNLNSKFMTKNVELPVSLVTEYKVFAQQTMCMDLCLAVTGISCVKLLCIV